MVEKLLDLGCDVGAQDEAGNTPWHSAAEGGNVDVVKRLLKSGASLEQRNGAGVTALHVASRCGRQQKSWNGKQWVIEKGGMPRERMHTTGRAARAAGKSFRLCICLPTTCPTQLPALKSLRGKQTRRR